MFVYMLKYMYKITVCLYTCFYVLIRNEYHIVYWNIFTYTKHPGGVKYIPWGVKQKRNKGRENTFEFPLNHTHVLIGSDWDCPRLGWGYIIRFTPSMHIRICLTISAFLVPCRFNLNPNPCSRPTSSRTLKSNLNTNSWSRLQPLFSHHSSLSVRSNFNPDPETEPQVRTRTLRSDLNPNPHS